MRTIFIPAKIKSEVNKPKILSLSKKLPKTLAIAYSIQYKEIAEEIKKILSKSHKITKFIQVLGCSKPNFTKETKAVLLIGSGKFHAVSLAFETKLPIYILENNKLEKISTKDIEGLEKSQKASYVKFLNAKQVGIMVSTKPGQQNLKKAIDFKKKQTSPNQVGPKEGVKQTYLFITNNIDAREFENFGLDSWVNTACTRMDMNDSRIINLYKLR